MTKKFPTFNYHENFLIVMIKKNAYSLWWNNFSIFIKRKIPWLLIMKKMFYFHWEINLLLLIVQKISCFHSLRRKIFLFSTYSISVLKKNCLYDEKNFVLVMKKIFFHWTGDSLFSWRRKCYVLKDDCHDHCHYSTIIINIATTHQEKSFINDNSWKNATGVVCSNIK